MDLYEIRADRADSGVVLDRLCQGNTVVLRDAPEIKALVLMLNGLGSLDSTRCDRFQFLHRKSALGIRRALGYADAALISGLVSVAVAATAKRYGLPTNGLVESGRMRAFFPPGYPRLWNRPARLYRSYLKKGVGAANPLHRDIASPHRATQVNFWFPLSPIHQDQSLEMFPELWGQDISMNSQNRVILLPPGTTSTQVEMGAGDVLLFHSENFHKSPQNSRREACRVSVDCRCVFNADDDHSYYGGGFQDISTFLPRDGQPRFHAAMKAFLVGKREERWKIWSNRLRRVVGRPANRRPADLMRLWAAAQWETDDDALALSLMEAASAAFERGDQSAGVDLCERVASEFPYSDDRLFRIISLLRHLKGGTAAKVAAAMIAQTQRPFWAVRLGDFMCASKDYGTAAAAYQRAHELSTRASELDEQMDARGTAAVTRYLHLQATNQHYVGAAERKLALLNEYGLMSSTTSTTSQDSLPRGAK